MILWKRGKPGDEKHFFLFPIKKAKMRLRPIAIPKPIIEVPTAEKGGVLRNTAFWDLTVRK